MSSAFQLPAFCCGEAVRAAVERHNTAWSTRWQRFLRSVPPPRWCRGMPVSAEWRGVFESFLPVAEFVASLRRVASLALPHPSWIPGALALRSAHLETRSAEFASLPDLWARLPSEFGETVLLEAERLWALLCALADPAQFGTAAGRYPGQLASLRRWLRDRNGRPTSLLDVGAGTGEGTLEALAVLREAAEVERSVGVTLEPLEAWMAMTGQRPHRPAAGETGVPVLVGEAARLPVRGGFSLILCNGLVGGRFVETDSAFAAILAEFSRLLAPGGIVLVGCRFHAGRDPRLARFRELAAERRWRVDGELRELVLWREGAGVDRGSVGESWREG